MRHVGVVVGAASPSVPLRGKGQKRELARSWENLEGALERLIGVTPLNASESPGTLATPLKFRSRYHIRVGLLSADLSCGTVAWPASYAVAVVGVATALRPWAFRPTPLLALTYAPLSSLP